MNRQIGPRPEPVQELIEDRREDIESAIAAGTDLVRSAMTRIRQDTPWQVRDLEVTFGIALSVDAGIIVSKVSAEASLEVKIILSGSSEHDVTAGR